MIERRGRIHPLDKVLVYASFLDEFAGSQYQAVIVTRQRTDAVKHTRLCRGDDPHVATKYQRQKREPADTDNPRDDFFPGSAWSRDGFTHGAVMLPHILISTIGNVQGKDALSASTNHRKQRKVQRNIYRKVAHVSQKVISFRYTLKGPDGKVLDSSADGEPLTFLEGVGQIIPGLESQLVTAKVGEKKHVKVKAKDAYGEKDPDNIVEVPLTQMPTKNIKVGDRFRAGSDAHSPVV